jgi:TonB-dependent receptor
MLRSIFTFVIFAIHLGMAAQSGTISGKVTDELTGEPLPGAAVVLSGTTTGTATNLQGEYILHVAREGSYEIDVHYIGYKKVKEDIIISEGENAVLNFKLVQEMTQLGEIIVRSNLEGQQKALNQQRTSDHIMNVVSADLMGRFPDLNVAEALQRVPGINISRSRGEGSTVSLRGTPPHFTTININGEQIPSTQDNGARNESLDLIPADQLASMEIIKALTPDMDGDAIGGAVNLRTPVAKDNQMALRAELGGGYNSMSQSYNGIGRFKVGKRFFYDEDDQEYRLGILAGFSYFGTDNEEDKEEVVWSPFGDTPVLSLGRDTVVPENYEIRDLKNQRNRIGATFTLDYKFSRHSDIRFNFMYSRRSDLDERNRLRIFLNESAGVEWVSLDTIRGTELRRDISLRDYYSENYSYNLEGRHLVSFIHLDWGLFYSDGRRIEDALGGRFERGADYRIDLLTQNANGVYTDFLNFQTVNTDLDLNDPFIINEVSRYDAVNLRLLANNLVGKFNASIPFTIRKFSFEVKTGVKFRSQANRKEYRNDVYNFSDPNRVLNQRAAFASVLSDYEDQDFMNGNIRFGPSIDPEKFRQFVDDNERLFVYDPIRSDRNSFNSSYKAREDIAAGYFMTKIHYSKAMVIAGLRYEYNQVNYDAYEVNNVTGESTPVSDGTSYQFLLPNIHLKYALNSLTNIRAALTYSYARPNFDNLVPFLNIDEEGSNIVAGNPELRPGHSTNLDLLFERYLGTVGIISGGLFFKNIEDFQFSRNLRFLRPGDPYYEEFPGFSFRQEQNGENAIVYGAEINVQSGLSFLPGLLKGTSVFFNYTFCESDAFTSDRDNINLPGQARHTWNASLSYEYRLFSLKASLNYNGEFLSTVAGEAQNDLVQVERYQLDINGSVMVSDNFRVFAEFLNVTNSPAVLYQGISERVAEYAYFGWWNRFGITYNF